MEQINLNRAELWPQPTPFAASTMALLLGVLVVAGGGLYSYQAYLLGLQREALAQAEARRDRIQTELTAAEKAHQKRLAALESLRSEVADLRQRVDAFRAAEEALTRRLRAAGSKGELVRALGRARARQDGVWLTRFRLQGVAPVSLRLEGKGLRPEAIPRYLRAVAAEEAYRGGFFRDITAETPEKGDNGEDGVLTFHSEATFPVIREDGP